METRKLIFYSYLLRQLISGVVQYGPFGPGTHCDVTWWGDEKPCLHLYSRMVSSVFLPSTTMPLPYSVGGGGQSVINAKMSTSMKQKILASGRNHILSILIAVVFYMTKMNCSGKEKQI